MARARPATVQRRRRSFGARLRTLRLKRGWSQEVLAERADVHRTYLSSVERGQRNISLDNIHALANALGVEVAALFAD